MWSLAAEAIGVRILRGESRSVGHPRTALYGVESPWLLGQPELQSPKERAWPHSHGEDRGPSKILWAQHGIMSTASRAQQHENNSMGTAEHHGYFMGSAGHHEHSSASWVQHHRLDRASRSQRHGHSPALSAFLRILTDTSGG